MMIVEHMLLLVIAPVVVGAISRSPVHRRPSLRLWAHPCDLPHNPVMNLCQPANLAETSLRFQRLPIFWNGDGASIDPSLRLK